MESAAVDDSDSIYHQVRGSDASAAYKSVLSHVRRSDRCKGSTVSKALITFGASDTRVGGAGSALQPRLGAARPQKGDELLAV